MSKRRDTVNYELKEGRTLVYVGTTNDPEARAEQHRAEGKTFSQMNVTSRRMTEDGAKRKEADRLSTYRKNQGRNPKYNKDSDG